MTVASSLPVNDQEYNNDSASSYETATEDLWLMMKCAANNIATFLLLLAYKFSSCKLVILTYTCT